MLRFFIIFLAVQAALFGAELWQPVQLGLVIPWTESLARISVVLLQSFDPDVHSYGVVIQSLKNGFGVSIQPGCNGVEACIILIAAMLAFPSPWKHKLVGIGLGILAVQAMNVLRVISLYYLGQWNIEVFEFAHLYLWQALIMLDVLVVWLLWVRYLAGHSLLPKFGS